MFTNDECRLIYTTNVAWSLKYNWEECEKQFGLIEACADTLFFIRNQRWIVGVNHPAHFYEELKKKYIKNMDRLVKERSELIKIYRQVRPDTILDPRYQNLYPKDFYLEWDEDYRNIEGGRRLERLYN